MLLRSKATAIPTFILATVVAASALPGPAGAAPLESEPDATATLIDEVAPEQGTVLVPVPDASGHVVTTDSVTVAVPDDPRDAVTASLPDGSEFSMRLPTELGLAEASRSLDGTIVYPATEGRASAAVQVLDNGTVRMQTIVPDAASTNRFTYPLDAGFTPVEDENGNIAALGPDGVVLLERAWARDAAGRDVPTHYELHDHAIVQVVETSATTTFPVVADPAWTWWNTAWGAKFSRAETNNLASAGSASAMCALLSRAAPALAVLCGAYGGYLFSQANIARNNKQCVFASVAPAPLVFRFKDNSCR